MRTVNEEPESGQEPDFPYEEIREDRYTPDYWIKMHERIGKRAASYGFGTLVVVYQEQKLDDMTDLHWFRKNLSWAQVVGICEYVKNKML